MNTWNVWKNCLDRTSFGKIGVCWYKVFVNEFCVFEQEVPTELHLQPQNFPPVGLSWGMSRAYSSVSDDIRRAQDTNDKSLGKKTERAILQKFGRKLNIGFTLRETFWLSHGVLLICLNRFDLTFQRVCIPLVEFQCSLYTTIWDS